MPETVLQGEVLDPQSFEVDVIRVGDGAFELVIGEYALAATEKEMRRLQVLIEAQIGSAFLRTRGLP